MFLHDGNVTRDQNKQTSEKTSLLIELKEIYFCKRYISFECQAKLKLSKVSSVRMKASSFRKSQEGV